MLTFQRVSCFNSSPNITPAVFLPTPDVQGSIWPVTPPGNSRGKVWGREGVYHLPWPSEEDTTWWAYRGCPRSSLSRKWIIPVPRYRFLIKPHFSNVILFTFKLHDHSERKFTSFTLLRGSTTFSWFVFSVSSQAKFSHAIFPDAVKIIIWPFSRL